jgi:transcriptional regulator with XRE-family HTH domain
MDGQLIVRIGRKIRETRLRQQLKLQEIAETAQISKGLLSRIENGRTVPSLPVLLSIIQALRVPMDTFFEGIDQAPPAPYVHRKAFEYTPFGKEEAVGFLYEHILSQNVFNLGLEATILTLQPGSRREPVTTDGFEFKYVLKGEVEYRLGEDTVLLQAGDSLFFNGRIPHVPTNRTNQPASMLAIYLLVGNGNG